MVRGFGAPETQAAFAVARDLAATVEDVSERFPAYYGLWVGSYTRGELTAMREVAGAFLVDMQSEPRSPEAVMAHHVFGMTRWFEGNFTEARRHLEQGLAIADAAQDREHVVRFGLDVTSAVMLGLPLVLWPLGALDRAGSLMEKAVAQALETGHIPSIAIAHRYAAIFEMMRRDRPDPRHMPKRSSASLRSMRCWGGSHYARS